MKSDELKALLRIERTLLAIADKLGVERPVKKPSMAGDVVAITRTVGAPMTVSESSELPEQLTEAEKAAMRFNAR